MGLFDKFKKKEKLDFYKYIYEEKELEELENYICEAFGNYGNVLHELISPDVHLDVCIVPPSEDEPYYKLVTMGAGAYKMKVPKEMEKYQIDRAEYVIYLPADWDLKSSDDKDYWPIKTLKDTARLPIWNDTWLFDGHTLQANADGSPYASNTKFNSVILQFAEGKKGDIRLPLSSGKMINFYEVIPIYPEELKFKLDNDSYELFDKLKEQKIQYKVLDLNRKNALL